MPTLFTSSVICVVPGALRAEMALESLRRKGGLAEGGFLGGGWRPSVTRPQEQ